MLLSVIIMTNMTNMTITTITTITTIMMMRYILTTCYVYLRLNPMYSNHSKKHVTHHNRDGRQILRVATRVGSIQGSGPESDADCDCDESESEELESDEELW